MSPWVLSLALLAQGILASGQLLLKVAMVQTKPRGQFVARFSMAIALQAAYFFIWLGILNWTPLSQLAPFDAVGPILIVVLAHVMLRERLSARGWMGVGLVAGGIVLIALS